MMKRSLLPTLICGVFFAVSGQAADHREAPLISNDPLADNTDVYAFVSPVSGKLVLAGHWIPFQEPTAGANYYPWGENVTYTIHVDNDGDALADIRYQLTVETTISDPDSAFYNVGPINSLGSSNLNLQQRATVTEVADSETVLVSNQLVPPANIGSKSTPDFATLFAEAVRTYSAAEGDINIYVGPADDPCFADLQISDHFTLRGQAPPFGYSTGNNEPQDSFAGFNASAFILELPISRVVEAEPVLGVWATSRTTEDGQISRTGTPFFGRLMLSMGHKDLFNSIDTVSDLGLYDNLQDDVEDPELASALCALYGIPLPGDGNADCHTDLTPGAARSGRGDMYDLLMVGMELANPMTINTGAGPFELATGFKINRVSGVVPVPAEMLRVNTSISGTTCSPTPHRLGLLAGDICGFPNGRRFMDDVFDIELLFAVGGVYSALDGRDSSFSFNSDLVSMLTDQIDANDKPFSDVFPYVAHPHSGQEHRHTLICLFIHGFDTLNDSLKRFREAMGDLVS